MTSFVGALLLEFQSRGVFFHKTLSCSMATLLDLPDEIILHILSFVASRNQILTVPRVCQRLRQLIENQWYWRSRYVQLCSAQPVLELASMRLWQEGCIQREFALTAAKRTAPQTELKGEASYVRLSNLIAALLKLKGGGGVFSVNHAH